MSHSLLFGVVVLSVVSSVKSDCSTLLSRIPYSLRIDETKTGIVLNISYDNADDWDVHVVRYNGIRGTPQKLKIVNSYFNLTTATDDRTLSLNVTKPIDLEELIVLLQVPLDSLDLEFKCGSVPKELRVIINPVNESPPQFKEFPYSITIKENTPAGTTVFNVTEKLVDKEVKRIGGFTYDIEPYKTQRKVDGINMFEIRLNSIGIVSLRNTIDFDSLYQHNLPTYYMLNLTVQSIPNLQTWALCNVTIQDVNDLNPVFIGFENTIAQYTINTEFNHRGSVVLKPRPIAARDPDSLDYTIRYSIEQVPYQFYRSFVINPSTGELRQINDVNKAGVLVIRATENTSDSPKYKDATVHVSLGNLTLVTSMTPRVKVIKNDDSTMRTAIIVLAVIALLIIIGIIIVFVIYHKKVVKSVSPKTDEEEKEPISTSENWNATTGSKTELLYADMSGVQGRGGLLPPLTKDTATGTEKKRSRRRNKNKEPEIFDGTREYEGKLEEDFFKDANNKTKIKQSTRSRDTKTETKYWITVPNDD